MVFANVFLLSSVLVAVSVIAWRAWKGFQIWKSNVDACMRATESEIFGFHSQLGQHYNATEALDRRLGNLDEAHGSFTERFAVFEDEVLETLGTLEDQISCVRYGLMEYGGFVRNTQ